MEEPGWGLCSTQRYVSSTQHRPKRVGTSGFMIPSERAMVLMALNPELGDPVSGAYWSPMPSPDSWALSPSSTEPGPLSRSTPWLLPTHCWAELGCQALVGLEETRNSTFRMQHARTHALGCAHSRAHTPFCCLVPMRTQ